MDDAQVMIYLLHEDFSVADADIAHWCNVTRVYINYVKQGKKHASPALTQKLIDLFNDLEDAHYHAKRKHYTWQRGEDPRRGDQHAAPAPDVRTPYEQGYALSELRQVNRSITCSAFPHIASSPDACPYSLYTLCPELIQDCPEHSLRSSSPTSAGDPALPRLPRDGKRQSIEVAAIAGPARCALL